MSNMQSSARVDQAFCNPGPGLCGPVLLQEQLFAARLQQVCCSCSNQSEDVEVRYFPFRPVLAEIDFRLLQIENYGDTELHPYLVAE